MVTGVESPSIGLEFIGMLNNQSNRVLLEQKLKLEYLLIFQKSGLPIYSDCYGSFCAQLSNDEALLSGFLSALTTMPSMFGEASDQLQNVEMGYTRLNFSYTTPSDHIICIGMAKDSIVDPETEKEIKELFQKLTTVLEEEYKDTVWEFLDSDEREKFGTYIQTEVIEPTSKLFEKHHVCESVGQGNQCPMDTEVIISQESEGKKIPLWEGLKKAYSAKSPPRILNLIMGIYARIYFWYDNRGFKKRQRKFLKRKEQSTGH